MESLPAERQQRLLRFRRNQVLAIPGDPLACVVVVGGEAVVEVCVEIGGQAVDAAARLDEVAQRLRVEEGLQRTDGRPVVVSRGFQI